MYLYGFAVAGILTIILIVTTNINTSEIKTELKEIKKLLNDLQEKTNK